MIVPRKKKRLRIYVYDLEGDGTFRVFRSPCIRDQNKAKPWIIQRKLRDYERPYKGALWIDVARSKTFALAKEVVAIIGGITR